jgi:succinate dehydrogenase/fumarate reductase flavoprotein subunit
MNVHRVSCDVLIIGGGGAGLRAAITARERDVAVTMVSKSRVGYGNNTYISKGTFAAATGWRDSRDNPDTHLRDSIAGGRFINDHRLLRLVTQEAGGQIEFLQRCGVQFSQRGGRIRVAHTPGHSYPRHVRSHNRSGRDFMIPLRSYAEKVGVGFMDRVFITKLLSAGGRIAGATGITQDGNFAAIAAPCVMLATGGFAQAYLHTNNAAGMTGDGHALAFELGIPLKDMEFIQFYPTASGALGSRLFLYEAVVFEAGAVLRNALGEDIIVKYGLNDPMAMTRDRLTRAVMNEILEGRGIRGGVLVDLSTLSEGDLRPLRHLLPAAGTQGDGKLIVSPTAHFCMGGVSIDEHAETSVPGLFAAGEVCAGVHGANRLGGNALAEVFSVGGIAGEQAARRVGELNPPDLPEQELVAERDRLESVLSGEGGDLKELGRTLKDLMWRKAGIIRDKQGLEEALETIAGLEDRIKEARVQDYRQLMRYLEFRHLMLLSEMVCRAALLRTESRGAHYRSDYPAEDDEKWLKNIEILKQDSTMSLEALPVPSVR